MKTTISFVTAGLLVFSAAANAQNNSTSDALDDAPLIIQNAAPKSLALEAAASYREQARFPRSSRPLTDGADPILRKREVSKQTAAGPGGSGPQLSIWNSAVSAEPGETLNLYAELIDGEPDESGFASLMNSKHRNAERSITARLVSEDSGLLGEVSYRDDGQAPDRRAGDGIYSARYTLPVARAPQPGYAENISIHVEAKGASFGERVALGGLLYSNPGARLTGHYRDSLRDGHLVISAEVDVLVAGRYHLAGTLNGVTGKLPGERPLAWAQQAKRLEAGKQWLELRYHGLIFNDMAANGPYTLASVTLTSALGMPNAMGHIYRDVYQTGAYARSEFTARSAADPSLMDAAARLDRQ